MIRFEMDVAAADAGARTIEGVLVPYGETARIDGTNYRFQAGSVNLARSRMPLLVDHDRGRPVGVLAELTETESGALGRFKIDATAAGDEALVQAASGSRGAFSVGAEIEESNEEGGVAVVSAARVHETSLLTLGAFDGATVTRVEAEADEPEDPEPAPEEPEPEPEEEETVQVESTAPAPMVIAERTPAPRELSAGEYVDTMLRAQRGDRDAARMIEAALTETISTDIPGLLPPTYESGVIGPAPIDRVLYDTFGGRALPGVGLAVQKPTWTTLPAGAWAATVDADATTSAAVVGLNAASVERWDWATAISYVSVQRSSPDAITTLYAGAIEDFYKDVETKIATLLDTTAGTPNAAIKLGAGIGAFYVRSGTAPEVIAVAPDVWAVLADGGALSYPAGAGAVIAGEGGLRSSFAGIPIVASGALVAGTKYMATRRALDVRVTQPVQLTANAIGALNVELGVVGEGLFDADVVLEVMELAAGAPMMMDAQAEKQYAAELAESTKAQKAAEK